MNHKVDDLPWQPTGCLSLISVEDEPFIAYVHPNGSWHLRYAWAGTAEPDTPDWVLSGGSLFSEAFFGISLAEVNGGRGVAAYLNGAASDQVYMLSDLATPAGAYDWQSHTVQAEDSVGYPCALIEVANRPAIAFANDTSKWLMFAQAQVSAPTAPADWLLSVVDECGASIGSIDAALVDGHPCVVYEVGGVVHCAWAKVAQPLVPRDWAYSQAADSFTDTYDNVSLAEIDAKPAVSFYNSTTTQLMYTRMVP